MQGVICDRNPGHLSGVHLSTSVEVALIFAGPEPLLRLRALQSLGPQQKQQQQRQDQHHLSDPATGRSSSVQQLGPRLHDRASAKTRPSAKARRSPAAKRLKRRARDRANQGAASRDLLRPTPPPATWAQAPPRPPSGLLRLRQTSLDEPSWSVFRTYQRCLPGWGWVATQVPARVLPMSITITELPYPSLHLFRSSK